MNTTWLRQDPVLRGLPRWLLWSLATTLLLLGLAVNLGLFVQRSHGHLLGTLVSTAALGLVLWLPTLVMLLSAGSRTRCSQFDLSLPVSAGFLWRRHVWATALGGGLLMLAIAGIAAMVLTLLARYTETSLPLSPAAFLRHAASLVAAFVLAVTLVQVSSPDRSLLPSSRVFAARTILVSLACFILALFCMRLPLIVSGIPIVIAWSLVRSMRPRLPAAWSLPSQWEESLPPTGISGGPDSEATSSPRLSGAWEERPQQTLRWSGGRWQLFLLRAMHSCTPKAAMTLWIGVPLLLGFGAILSGAFIHMGDDEIRWTMFFITIYMLFALFAKPLGFLHFLDAIPLSRRHLFALLTLPSLFFLLMGYGAGRLFLEWKGTAPAADMRTLKTCAGVGVPTEFLTISWNGRPERLVAPWGESHTPFAVPLFRGLRPMVVSRFCTRDSNVSLDYQVFQAQLAAQVMHAPAPEAESLRVFLGGAGVSQGPSEPRHLVLKSTHIDSSEAAVFPIMMALVCIGAFGSLGLYLRTFRMGRLDRLRKVVFVGTLGVLLALHMAQFLALALRLTTLWSWDVLWKRGAPSLAAALPGGIPSLWVLAGAVILGTYVLAEMQFRRAELPRSGGKTRC